MSSSSGQPELNLHAMETEGANPASAQIDQMSALEIVQIMNAEDARVALAVQQELPQIARAVEESAKRLRQGGRLIYLGAGTSGRLGILDASECPPTFSTPPELVIGLIAGGPPAILKAVEGAEDNPEGGKADLQQLHLEARDVVVGIAASGRTPYVLGAVAYAREVGALTVGLACNSQTPLHSTVDIMIALVVGPEIVSGSTRLKAGTAQKMALNMLSTGVMILLGKTYGNQMVDVHASNYKLQRRASKIVQTIAGIEQEQADALLAQCDGETKTAIVVARAHVSPQEARQQLAAHQQVLRATLAALQAE
ncbi:N-acetylmuramic acid 6-phosphate etherase [Ktedonobacter racemifer]|uniref:N-acetylmuramic acid 6-phosphate etherase n=1 Tax=Ktedonobacter racemifer DSM 44963 TaxID=485913 RepID=D6TRN3_KTERA|nr:N-acetylmuramic acid 6-phosphate etherase [Ktedonobacter racemifer]EFH85985.1 glucokinase regulatory-like protein [Ktedonobacter racemifer DSM 44963]